MLGLFGEPSGRAEEVDTRVEVLEFRMECVKGSRCRNTMDHNFMPDFILPKASCCRYGCFDGFLNGMTVRFEDREGRGIVFGDK